MKRQRAWLLLVSALLLCGTIACGERSEVVEQGPKGEVKGTQTVVNKPDVSEERGSPIELTNSIGMKLRLIPAGEFMMGSGKSPAEIVRLFEDTLDILDTASDVEPEHPQHRIRITRPFYLGVHEVTQGEWEQVMRTRPWSGREYVKEGPNYPATYVSWEDAVEFCRELSGKENCQYRLPAEAEWEYACRAGSKTVYSFGDDLSELGTYAWYGWLGDGNCKDKPYAHPVGQKRANAWGLHDMHGNVWEWCSDWFEEDYYGESPSTDPSGPSTSISRVFRGGCWGDYPMYCRSAYRNAGSPDSRKDFIGFRVALVPVDASGKNGR